MSASEVGAPGMSAARGAIGAAVGAIRNRHKSVVAHRGSGAKASKPHMKMIQNAIASKVAPKVTAAGAYHAATAGALKKAHHAAKTAGPSKVAQYAAQKLMGRKGGLRYGIAARLKSRR